MKAIVFGANGKTGREVTRYCVQAGFDVTAFVHQDRGLWDETIVGDVLKDVSCVKRFDVVFYCIGHVPNMYKDVCTEGMKNILSFAETQRVVAVTGEQVFVPGDSDTWWTRLSRKIFSSIAPKRFADGQQMTDLLLSSSADFTVVRSPRMVQKDLHEYVLGMPPVGLLGSVSHKATAHAMVQVATDTHWSGACPCIRRS